MFTFISNHKGQGYLKFKSRDKSWKINSLEQQKQLNKLTNKFQWCFFIFSKPSIRVFATWDEYSTINILLTIVLVLTPLDSSVIATN